MSGYKRRNINLDKLSSYVRKTGTCTEEAALHLMDEIMFLRMEVKTAENNLKNTVIVPVRQYDKLVAENKESKQLEKQYSNSLGRMAQLCDIVCPWVIGDGRPVVPMDVFLAADEIMDYVDAVRP